MTERILLLCNGPSGQWTPQIRNFGLTATTFRVNHWYLDGGYCNHWFVGEHREAWLPVVAQKHVLDALKDFDYTPPTVWLPGLNLDTCREIQRILHPWPLRVQRFYDDLPAACRWNEDPRPRRPLNGSFALAVAVAMKPDELMIAGMDLYQHPSGRGYASGVNPPDHAPHYAQMYAQNLHGNHNLISDLKYIRAALEAYAGKVICIGSVMKNYFARDFPQWEWHDG